MKLASKLLATGTFCIVCLVGAKVATASAPYEAPINELVVTYDNTSSIGIKCERDECVLEVQVRGTKYMFDSDDLGGQPVPQNLDRPVLFSKSNIRGEFSFEAGLDCNEADYPNSEDAACYANYLVRDGTIVKMNRFTR